MDYVIINNKKSTEITGLLITAFSAIRKPKMRTLEETVQGKDGSEIINLGYEAYTRRIEIGLSFNYNIDKVIEYFNQSGEIIFSNEPDKVYKFKQIKEIDFEKLLRFKTAIVEILVQPFKKERNEEEQNATTKFSNANGNAITLKDSEQAQFKNLKIYGKSWQDKKPTWKEPKEVHSIDKPKVNVCGKNLFGGKFLASVLKTNLKAVDVGDGCYKFHPRNAKNKTLFLFNPEKEYTLFFTAKPLEEGAESFNIHIKTESGSSIVLTGKTKEFFTFSIHGTGWEFLKVSWDRGDTVIDTLKCGIFEGKVSKKDFEKYQPGGTVTLPYTLKGVPVKASGNYTDEDGQEWVADYVDFEKGVLVRNAGFCQATGDNIHFRGEFEYAKEFQINKIRNAKTYIAGQMCDIATGQANWNEIKIGAPFCYFTNDYWFTVGVNKRMSNQDFKNVLNAKPLNIIYTLETPEEIPLSETELNAYKQLTTLYPFTSILNAQGAFMEVEYQKQSIVINRGNTTARPIIYLEGSGKQEIYINNNLLLTVDLKGGGNITIDAEQMEAYDEKGLRNRDVDGDYNNVVLKKGENSVKVTGNCTKCTLKNVSRWL